jgi:selenide, water dikinase
MLCGLDIPSDENVLIGLNNADDAGVYRISDTLALIQTVDFFTPIVDDPYWFGQIAAANALSDVYAMGGIPKTAMNLVGFPLKTMEPSILRQMIEGGLDKLKEADVVLVGGHSIEDPELKYGLSVTGFVHPEKIWSKHHLQSGDALILTKPLGTGIINTAIKGGLATGAIVDETTRLMATLNRSAAEVMSDRAVNACTDITGFGLLGHLAEMVIGSGCRVRIDAAKVPVIDRTVEFASMGLMPAGAYKNKEFRAAMVSFDETVDPITRDIFFDPQTSGGLLFSVDQASAGQALKNLIDAGCTQAAIIGEVIDGPAETIQVNP